MVLSKKLIFSVVSSSMMIVGAAALAQVSTNSSPIVPPQDQVIAQKAIPALQGQGSDSAVSVGHVARKAMKNEGEGRNKKEGARKIGSDLQHKASIMKGKAGKISKNNGGPVQ